MVIDCATCRLRESDACRTCLVTFLLDREPDDAVVIDVGEARVLRVLQQGGLVPELRHTSADLRSLRPA